MKLPEGWIRIWTFQDSGELYTAKAGLELQGVKVVEQSFPPYHYWRMGGHQLFVHIDQYVEAAKFMNEHGYSIPSFINKEEYWKSLSSESTSVEQKQLRWLLIGLGIIILAALIMVLLQPGKARGQSHRSSPRGELIQMHHLMGHTHEVNNIGVGSHVFRKAPLAG